MNSLKKIERYGSKTEVWFTDDVWVSIDLAPDDMCGSWEYMEGDDDETYFEGGLWKSKENRKLIEDYDGISELPPQVIDVLEHIGYDCSEIK